MALQPDSFETVTYEVANRVAWVTLNRPDRHNAFNDQMLEELSAIWAHLKGDKGVGCVVLTGAGPKAFCTGLDRSEALGSDDGATPLDDDAYLMHFEDPGFKLGPKSSGLWTPVIAAVNGMACGGAFYLLGEVDIIVASETATFFDPHVTYGMPAVYETIHLVQRMPLGEVLRMQLLGAHERMSAQRAYEIGFVSEIASAGELHDRTRWIAETIAARPLLAVQGTVRSAWAAKDLTRSQAIALGNPLLAVSSSAANLAEGQRFFESGERVTPRTR